MGEKPTRLPIAHDLEVEIGRAAEGLSETVITIVIRDRESLACVSIANTLT